MNKTRLLGERGELLAKKYLISLGKKIIATNYRTGHQEIDIIARDQRGWIFVEVKTRTKSPDSQGEDPLLKWQSNNLKRAILAYCRQNHLNPDLVHLDLIIILYDKKLGTTTLKHYRDVL